MQLYHTNCILRILRHLVYLTTHKLKTTRRARFVPKPPGKNKLGREDADEFCLRSIKKTFPCDCVDWFDMSQDMNQGRTYVNMVG
jgi:hypothetical protein